MNKPVSDPVTDRVSAAPSVAVNIFVKSRQVYATDLSSSLELGRQQVGEAPPYTRIDDRVVMAKLEENEVSRKHVLLTLLADQKVRVTNGSGGSTILAGTDDRIQPGDHRDVIPPALLSVCDRVIQLEPRKSEPAKEIMQTLSHRTMAPGLSSRNDATIDDILSAQRSDKDTEYLLRGLLAAVSVFQSASNSSEFLSSAAQAMIDIVGLETAAALTFDGSKWKVEAFCQQTGVGPGDEAANWQPSQTILRRVRDEKRTFWQFLGAEGDRAVSLADVKLLMAAPILNSNEDVVGVLYGDQRWTPSETEEVSEVEAILVELMSTSVAAGMARLEQEQAAVKARVLFDQFFTPELSRQLEAEPNLLLGKDTEVSLLFCDIRGFSHVSEKLGARLTLDWINDVMGTLSHCVAENHGVLVDTLGDELVGMWGAPVDRPDHAKLACQAAIEMLQQLTPLNRRWQDALENPVDLGIGIHTGVARVGNIGSERKFKYGPLGNTVHIARRAKRATEQLMTKILITSATADKLDTSFSTRRLCRVLQDDPIELYELAVDIPADWLELKRRFEAALEAYERKDYPTAIRLLARVLTDHPGDRPSLYLLSQTSGEYI